ncbi:MAG: hypothetical protein PHN49_01395 [Candidatus Omnitrophica bacterium]|nr:hypothetical protein [Candidatus Omnitrophota bacterium]MDD5670272.1 hypothetical protein [Candidatus Omnitrophota bacterium]
MKYRRVLTHEHLQITTSTNSFRLHQLIHNFFDFQRSPHSTPQMKVKLCIQIIKNRNDQYIYQSLNKNNRIFSFMDTRTVRVTTDLRTNTATARLLEFDESLKERILDFALMRPLYHILGHHGFFHMHASWVSKNNSSILISGPTNSGKSTLAFVLAQHGFQIHCDDDCFVKASNRQIHLMPLPTKMGLKETVLNRHPKLVRNTVKNYLYGDKKRISLKNIPNHRVRDLGEPTRIDILFPKYKIRGNAALKPISKTKGLKKLIGECLCAYPENDSRKMLWTFYSLAQKTRFFELIYNDQHFDQIPAIMDQLDGALKIDIRK